MSTPNPALAAASPILKAALTLVNEFLTTVLTGDPMQIPLRADSALLVLQGKLQLLLPQLATAEEAVVLQQATASINGLLAKLP